MEPLGGLLPAHTEAQKAPPDETIPPSEEIIGKQSYAITVTPPTSLSANPIMKGEGDSSTLYSQWNASRDIQSKRLLWRYGRRV